MIWEKKLKKKKKKNRVDTWSIGTEVIVNQKLGIT